MARPLPHPHPLSGRAFNFISKILDFFGVVIKYYAAFYTLQCVSFYIRENLE